MADRLSRWVNVALAAGVVVVLLLLFEGGLRLVGFEYPQFHQPDLRVGWALRPNSEGWSRAEGSAFVKINREGQRDREHARRKDAGTVRIAVLGDSFAEAPQVAVDRTFWAVMEARINQCRAFGDKVVETINFGVSGYGTAQQLLVLRSSVWAFSPDIVLVALFHGNDVTNNSKRLEPLGARPFFVPRDGVLIQDDSFRERLALRVSAGAAGDLYRRATDYSRTLQLVQFARARAAILLAQRRSASGTAAQRWAGLDLQPELYRTSPSDEWAEAWAITGGLLGMIRDDVASRGARLILVTLSNDIQVHPDRAIRERIANDIGADSLFRPDEAIREIASRSGIEHIALAPEMLRWSESTRRFLHGFDHSGFGHWNEDGHRVAGTLIAEVFCARKQ